jgi:hypothetical protein
VSFAAITLCIASQRVFIVVVVLIRYRLSPETFRYTLVRVALWDSYVLACRISVPS